MKKRIYFWIMVSGLIWLILNLLLLAYVALMNALVGEALQAILPSAQWGVSEAAWVIPLSMVFFGTILWTAASNKEK